MWWSALTREIRRAESGRQRNPNIHFNISLKVCGMRSEAFIDRYEMSPGVVDDFVEGLIYAGTGSDKTYGRDEGWRMEDLSGECSHGVVYHLQHADRYPTF